MVKDLLVSGGEFSGKRLDLVEKANDTTNEQLNVTGKDSNDSLIVVSVLIASLSFAAVFTLPEMSKDHKIYYESSLNTRFNPNFYIADIMTIACSISLSMFSSIIATFIFLNSRSQDNYLNKKFILTGKVLLKFSMLSLMVAFMFGINILITPYSKSFAKNAFWIYSIVFTVIIERIALAKEFEILRVLLYFTSNAWTKGLQWSSSMHMPTWQNKYKIYDDEKV